MLLIREIFYCNPGKVRTLVEKFQAMNRIGERKGWPSMRLMTDLSGERYWTLVAEMEVESFDAFTAMMSTQDEDTKEFEEIMKDYHSLVQSGRREIYTIVAPEKSS